MSSNDWSGDDEFRCPVCEDVFDSESELREHTQSNHPEYEEH